MAVAPAAIAYCCVRHRAAEGFDDAHALVDERLLTDIGAEQPAAEDRPDDEDEHPGAYPDRALAPAQPGWCADARRRPRSAESPRPPPQQYEASGHAVP